MEPYDDLYVQYLYYFNEQRDYFECHEVMEALWLEQGRSPLFQGLLQVAVGLYHHANGNPGGSVKLFTAGIVKLEPYPALTMGIDLGKLLADSRIYLERLGNREHEPFMPYDLTIVITDTLLADLVEEVKANPPAAEHEE
jgi:uncharacterized protein